ncbi:MAG: hypothetical protein DRO15_02410 [Thermoprotei archaeon]|nr:MAG: hypothetical protein DRO15_02410 [Thermoprotei archaeon]
MSQRIKIVVIDDKFVISEGKEFLWEGREIPGIGKVLHFVEVAYLLYTGRAEVFDDRGNKLGFEEFFSKYSSSRRAWILFTVYFDLRKRGKRAKPGLSDSDVIVEHQRDSLRIFVTEENTQLSLRTIIEWIEDSLRKGYKPIMAVVDMYGDVTYYELSKINLPKIR